MFKEGGYIKNLKGTTARKHWATSWDRGHHAEQSMFDAIPHPTTLARQLVYAPGLAVLVLQPTSAAKPLTHNRSESTAGSMP